MIPEAGKSYHVNHTRKGQFDMEVQKVVESIDGDHWASGPIIAGQANFISRNSDKAGTAGEHITVRVSITTFEEIQP